MWVFIKYSMKISPNPWRNLEQDLDAKKSLCLLGLLLSPSLLVFFSLLPVVVNTLFYKSCSVKVVVIEGSRTYGFPFPVSTKVVNVLILLTYHQVNGSLTLGNSA